MISWQTKLKPGQMQNVASYILTLVGTEPLKPKDPQGELYVPETEEGEMEEAPADEADSVEVEEPTETVTASL